ncbi:MULTISPECIES: helix-turn-helix domain-containing protein [unclassified Agrococcus]|uniref:helix-turn-helix domain-containing protein n=1 Tax=unclassified Agrococcus TaxID=2615065 RepID=UPI0036211D81
MFNVLSPVTDAVQARSMMLAREHRELRQSLVQMRRDAGLTQKQLADRMGITQQAVQKFERYDADPRLSTLRRYANAVGALIFHEIEEDRGQSIDLCAASPWEQTSAVRVTWNAPSPSWEPTTFAEWAEAGSRFHEVERAGV